MFHFEDTTTVENTETQDDKTLILDDKQRRRYFADYELNPDKDSANKIDDSILNRIKHFWSHFAA